MATAAKSAASTAVSSSAGVKVEYGEVKEATITLGPVIGKTTDTAARVLVELSHDAKVTAILTKRGPRNELPLAPPKYQGPPNTQTEEDIQEEDEDEQLDAPEGKLTVSIIEGKSLPALDSNGTSDPYVKLSMEGQSYKTRVIDKNLNPVWAETFTFNDISLAEELTLTAWDRDLLGDDKMGEIILDLRNVQSYARADDGQNWQHQAWYSLNSKVAPSAQIHVKVSFEIDADWLKSQADRKAAAISTTVIDEKSITPTAAAAASALMSPISSSASTPIVINRLQSTMGSPGSGPSPPPPIQPRNAFYPSEFRLSLSIAKDFPRVFQFRDLEPNTIYDLRFEGVANADDRRGEVHTFNPEAKELRVIVAACDHWGPTKRGKVNMYDKLYNDYVKHDRVDLIVRHGDQVYADDAFKQGEKILKRKDIDEKQKDALILEAYKKVYRFTWNKDDVRRIYANCQHLMLWDDHELTNDWGTFKPHYDRASYHYRIGLQARQAYWQYQRQLWDDVYDTPTSGSDNVNEGSYHTWGSFGVMLVDGRGCRSFGRVEGDVYPFFSSKQYNDMRAALIGRDGAFRHTRSLLAIHSMPPVFLGSGASRTVGKIKAQVDKMGLALYPQEQASYIQMLADWKRRNNSEVLLMGGDLHFGIQSEIMNKDSTTVLFRQVISSAISNSPPPKVVYYMLRSGISDINQISDKFTFRHTHFFNERNFAYTILQTHGTVPTINERVVTARVPPPSHFTLDRAPSTIPPRSPAVAPGSPPPT